MRVQRVAIPSVPVPYSFQGHPPDIHDDVREDAQGVGYFAIFAQARGYFARFARGLGRFGRFARVRGCGRPQRDAA
ncbi:hypothetical protein [Novacetimonas hansenii]|uniref:hypothetical protein n=1 Tax=Novacetimonas hansenii TaxID=436 RepID=UPI00094F6FBB|nr:hypothetical protein [Novacetimonas hansenii]